MHSIHILVLAMLLHVTLQAQPAVRLGVNEGIGFTGITYHFLGKEHDRKIESMAHLGLVVEVPLSDHVLLAFRPALTTLNDNAGLAARVQTDGGSRYYRSSISEQWIMELPLLAKVVFHGRELRPYFSLGGFLDINPDPAVIALAGDSDPPSAGSDSYEKLYGGVMVAVGVEINAAEILLITPELGLRQFLSRPIDGAFLTQNNNPRFLFTVGILFPLSYERW
ncbi:MAG: hypothetical protein RRA94_08940 [Bacteroidota bacterium]|nr:hypothetical protein [Bacteroidota bacterium]